MPKLQIDLDLIPRLQLALQQNGVEPLSRLRLTHLGEDALNDLQLSVRVDPEIASPLVRPIARIDPGSTLNLADLTLAWSTERLVNQTERAAGHLHVQVKQGETQLADQRFPIEVLAYNEWPGSAAPPELLGAFVLPNHPAVQRVLSAARERLAERTGRPDLEGYQSNDPARILAIAGAIYESIAALGITYSSPPASFERTGQKVRTPDQVLDDKMGTCLDLTVLLAASLEQAGLHPLMIAVEGHAFPGVWLIERAMPVPSDDDPVALRKRVDLGEIVVFDSSGAAQGVPFKASVRLARQHLEDAARFRFVVDLTTSRRTGIRPLSMRARADFQALPDTAPNGEMIDIPASELPALPVAPEAPNGEHPSGRLDRWKNKLLDLSLNNRMLNHRDGKRVLPLLEADLAQLEDTLSGGKKLTLTPRANVASPSPGVLWLDLPPAEAEKRMVALFREGRSHIQETGTNATYLALGFLRWFESTSSEQPRLAPLILLPILLQRTSARGPYTVQLADDDPQINVSLLEKLHKDFGISTSGYDALPTDAHGLDVAQIFANFRHLVRDLSRFEVVEAGALTLYSFRKFLMWRDLQERTDDLLRSPIVQQLIDPSQRALPEGVGFIRPEHLDRERPAPLDLSVVDADSSQLSAVFGALDGNSFILQGPPGTGKSQTITNLIAQALADQKTVLFVAEKRAALDVVRDRLNRVGLGEFCLEAHSEKAAKRAIIRQFEAPLQLARQAPPSDWARHADALQTSRLALNDYVDRIHAPGPFDESLFQAISRLISLHDAPDFPVENPPPDASTLAQMEQAITVLATRIDQYQPPAQSPWSAVQHRDWSPRWSRQVQDALQQARGSWETAEQATNRATQALSLPTPTQVDALPALSALFTALLQSPRPTEALVHAPPQQIETTLEPLIARGLERQAHWEALSGRYHPTLLEADLRADARLFQTWSAIFFLSFFVLFFARRRLRAHALGPLPSSRLLAQDLTRAAQIQALDRQIEGVPEADRLLGHRLRGAETDWREVQELVDWVARFRRILVDHQGTELEEAQRRRGHLIAYATGELLAPGAPARRLVEETQQALEGWRAARTDLLNLLQADHLGETRLSHLGAHLTQMQQRTDELQAHTACLRAADAANDLGLQALVDPLLEAQLPADQAQRALHRGIRQHWVEQALEADQVLRHFRGQDHELAIERFRSLDTQARVLAQKEIRARLIQRLPDPGAPGDMALLRRETAKSSGHLPVRTLLSETANILPWIKPCVLMSPLSVARYLDPKVSMFDLVIFDEASQIPPWDAIGAIARGRQVVVVGDSKQLPPTTFFQRGGDEEPDDDDRMDLESILDECVAAGLPSHPLRWHYRSRHESLIAFSNYHYYDNKLHTFPSARSEVPELGVKWVHVPDGYYDRGRSRTNRGEAEAVVREIVRRLKDPVLCTRSIGVVTFAMTQQRLIEDLLDEAMQDPQIEAGAGRASEPLFVKNLENVQGDERDVMLFSVGYGPDKQGSVTMNFGPLNRTGGERRLNVAITRAKELLIVFSTLRPEQIDLSRTRAVGVQHFKTFLDYAARGPRAIDEAVQLDPRRDFESPFEEEVSQRLEALGHLVHRQVGVAGYRIDLAVADPDAPGAYLLGIECDGATYHSARAARDRDRTRAAVLKGLGWRLHRIWSTDWWQFPERELQRLIEAIEAAKRAPAVAERPPPPPAQPKLAGHDGAPRGSDGDPIAAPAPAEPAPAPSSPWPDEASPWAPLQVTPGGPKDAFYSSDRQIIAQIAAAAAEAPLPLDTLFRQIASSWGFGRAGRQIREKIETCARRTPGVRIEAGFLWRDDQDPQRWAGFRYVPEGGERRDLGSIPAREIDNASRWVIRRATSLKPEDLYKEVATIFGYANLSDAARTQIGPSVERLVQEGVALRSGERIIVPRGHPAD